MTSSPGEVLREQISAARDLLGQAGGGLYALGEDDLSALAGDLLGLRAAAEALAVAVAVEAESRGVITASTATGMAGWIQARAGEAGVTVAGPEANAWQTVTKKVQAKDMGVFAQAVTSGRIGVAAGAVLARELRRIRASVPAATWDACVGEVVEFAAGGASARELAGLRAVVIGQYGDDPDHLLKRERGAHESRELSRFRVDPDGLHVARMACDGAYAAVIEAVVEALSGPHPVGVDGQGEGLPDGRTAGQRRMDAVLDLFRAFTTHPDAAPFGITPAHAATDHLADTGPADSDHPADTGPADVENAADSDHPADTGPADTGPADVENAATAKDEGQADGAVGGGDADAADGSHAADGTGGADGSAFGLVAPPAPVPAPRLVGAGRCVRGVGWPGVGWSVRRWLVRVGWLGRRWW